MKAIILAAGRGSRLENFTLDRPKCMVELHGQALLQWQMAALKSAGIEDVLVVTGYKREVINLPENQTRYNPNWASSNMVASLLCASGDIREPVIISYSDIIYSPKTISELMVSEGDISISIDRNWEDLWRRRFADPLSDAESLVLGDGNEVLEIGQKISDIDQVDGQYMGLLRITEKAINWVKDLSLSDAENFRNLDMTSLLSLWLEQGFHLQSVDNKGAWCEIDSASDLEVARHMLKSGEFDTSFMTVI